MKHFLEKLHNHLFLFDIDGTIMDSKGDGKKSFVNAIEKTVGIKHNEEINFLGGIDNVIFRNIYTNYKLPETSIEKSWESFKKDYSIFLKDLAKKSKWLLFPNVKKLIKILYKNSNIGIVTGNIKIGAKIKLDKFNLNRYFKCGGYGDYALDRKFIVNNAIKDCELFYKKSFNRNNIFLFGDTLKDVESAIQNNISPILIENKQKSLNSKNMNIIHLSNYLNIKYILEKIIYNK